MSAFVVASFNRTESRAQKAALECLEQRKTYVSGVRGVVEIIHIAAMFVQTVKQVR